MPISITQLASEVVPEHTVLFFGAGTSIPSHGPSGNELAGALVEKCLKRPAPGLTLPEVASLSEAKVGRPAIIKVLREALEKVRPTGGLLTMPHYEWKSIFTTNYDTLVEQCYVRLEKPLVVYSSNFDFVPSDLPNPAKLFKIHGTVEKDISDGHRSRMIVTLADYDQTQDYREQLYSRFAADLAGAHLVVVGHSMQDPDISEVIQRAVKIRNSSGGHFRLTTLIYERDENRAALMETRGFQVCFGGVNDFFDAMARRLPETRTAYKDTGNVLDKQPSLVPVTLCIQHALGGSANVSSMFNGRPASYADIQVGLTFARTLAKNLVRELSGGMQFATVLGASGVGKTTAARQCLLGLKGQGFLCWEHSSDYGLQVEPWLAIAKLLEAQKLPAVLFIDEAHNHLNQINDLADKLVLAGLKYFRLIIISARHLWWARIKSPALLKHGRQFVLRQLDSQEIDSLLNLVDSNTLLRPLIESSFSGFSVYERRRRLQAHCEADTFVCLKNIFASEKFDDIILKEYADLEPQYRDIYRLVSAMESTGIQVHRQLVMRLLGIDGESIPAVLKNLEDIVREISVDEKEGIYAWRGRHMVIADIVTKYKFQNTDELLSLFHKVVDNIQPTYNIEIRTLRELCDSNGIGRISDIQEQNILFRKMASIAPGERIPRHRLIRNLIRMEEFDQAETEIRIFTSDFKLDSAVARYKVMLLVQRSRTAGLLKEDREKILSDAADMAVNLISRFPYSTQLITTYCDLGLEYLRLCGSYQIIDAAMKELKVAEDRIGDPEIGKHIGRFARLLVGSASESERMGNAIVVQ